MKRNFVYNNKQKLNNPFNGYPNPGPYLSLNTLNVSYINLLSGASGPFPSVGYQGATGYQGYQGYQGSVGAGGTIGYYGVFYDTTSQIATTANTGYAMTFNNTAESFGISMVSGSRLTFQHAGTYNIQFSAQLTQSNNAVNQFNIWLRKNGLDLPDTNTYITMDRKNGDKVASWNFMYSLNANDYLQLLWQTDNVASYISATGAQIGPIVYPSTPSVILTASQVAYSIVGATGYQGATGPQGYQGYQGYQGATGYQGVAGNVTAGLTLFLDGPTTTYSGSTILDQSLLSPNLGTQTSIDTGIQNNTTIQLAEFLSPTGTLSTTAIPAGLWELNSYVSSTNSTVSFYFGVSYVDQNGTSNRVNIATGTSASATPITTLTPSLYTASLYVPATTVPDITKRIIVSVFFFFSAGGNRSGTLYMRDNTNSHVHTTLISQQPVGTYWGDYQYWNPTLNNWNIGSASVILGQNAGYTNQGTNAVAIGYQAGYTNQASYSVAIGYTAGSLTQGFSTVAIGAGAGYASQSSGAVALGHQAGYTVQGNNAVAIGYQAGYTTQGQNTVAIGRQSGSYGQGTNSVAIGYLAGQTNQVANSIAINASGGSLNASTQGFFVNPIRSATFTNVLGYNSSTSEILYSAKSFVINHPLKKDRYLVHACLEGPEAGVYYRGKSEITNGRDVTVRLPNYVSGLATNFTVQITPIFDGGIKSYNCSEIIDNEFTVHGDNGKFYWVVYGSRQDIEVEPRVDDFVVKGSGPYRWLQNVRE